MASTQYYINYKSKPGNAIKMRARAQVASAIQSGRLLRQPCETCGAAPTEAHHEDYDAPLEVRWFCRPCHIALHVGPRSSHCQRGHALTGHNLKVSSRGPGQGPKRACRTCFNEGRRRMSARKSA